jgi:PAS domain S-box-containing protein
LEPGRSKQHIRESASRQAALAEFGQRALAGAAPSLLMNQAARVIADTLRASHSQVWEIVPGAALLSLRAAVGWKEGRAGRLTVGLRSGDERWVRLLSAPCVAEGGRKGADATLDLLLGGQKLASGVTAPIGSPDRPVGLLAAYSAKRRRFTADEIHFLQSIANTLAAAAERARTEGALRASEKRYRLLAENAQDLIFRYQVAPTRKFEYVSPAAMLVTGYSPEEFYDDPDLVLKLVHPADRPLLQATRLSPTESPGRFALRWVQKSGSMLWVEVRNTPIYDEAGSIVAVEGIARDITVQKQVEQALRRSEARLAEAQQIAHLGNWQLDLRTNELQWSDEVYRIFGAAADRFPGTMDGFYAWIHPEEREFVRQRLNETIRSKAPFQMDHRIVRDDGSERTVHHKAEAICDESGKVIRIFATVQDITERKALEEQVRDSRKAEAVGRLAEAVAEDLGDALTALCLGNELTPGRAAGDERLRRAAEEVRRAAESAALLTRHLLAFRHTQAVRPKLLNLNSLLSDLRELLCRLLGGNIRLVISAEPGLNAVEADPAQLEQAVLNLALNSLDAVPAGGELTLDTRNADLDAEEARAKGIEPGRYVVLTLSETGSRVEPALQARTFQPAVARNEPRQGGGPGWPAVLEIIRRSRGHIEAGSIPGRGATFNIYLPAVEGVVEGAGAQAALCAPPRRGSEVVLLVEGREGMRELLGAILEENGYTVLAARDAAEAEDLSARHSGPIHLLITELLMPGVGGRDLAQRLACSRPAMKVLYISSQAVEALVPDGSGDADMALLRKPFRLLELLNKVREALDAAAARR